MTLSVDEMITWLEDQEPDVGNVRPDYLRCLYRHAGEIDPGGIVLEIGCYKGYSTLALALGLEWDNCRVITVDPIFMTGSYTYPNHTSEYGTSLQSSLSDVYHRFCQWSVQDRILVVPQRSQDFIKFWEAMPISFSLILIDAEHTRRAVEQDSEWLKFAEPGALVLYDDWIAETREGALNYMIQHPEWTMLHDGCDGPRGNFLLTTFQKSHNDL